MITGAGSGIGAAIARRLAGEGALLSLAGRRAEPLYALAKELGLDRTLAVSSVDVTDPAAIARGFEAARAKFGPVSILVNNAGEAPSAPFEKTELDLWEKVIGVDLTGVFNVTKAALADLKGFGKGARIINIASTAGLTGYPYVSAYCAAKHGVIGLTRALALELAKTGVTVNAVCPGFTDTPIIARSVEAIVAKTGRTPQAALSEFTKHNPQGRLVEPEEVADTVAWLAGPQAQAINGQAIAVSGGEVQAG
ncbi:SDR family oxidoreductase [Allorhizobium sp. BGMRC 0089]|uniref:SDR family NAD(P)-dependent oxidoreductase n=1 Tax=Allorhizobium sonneratiae TaxID=2934936 RepID=UPI002033A026|nr:SDR family NAD(P)-dependent oxidoreductase [Allorhizobium sonneratiae]MCM2294608.1 SDR family oxidoreductase [Allorhizobium sonneratiae]